MHAHPQRALANIHERANVSSRQRLLPRSLLATLCVALVQGMLFLVLMPPWQHYDEPTHFEYAWLSANRTLLPEVGDENPAIRREIAASMWASGFFNGMPKPDLLTDSGETWIGITELRHPPTYYALVGLPLRLVSHLDVTTQLYVARSVSLALFIATCAVVWQCIRELVPPGHVLRWAVPLAVPLIPPFADQMTAVNNDVGVVLLFSVFLWGALRAIRRGLNWRRAVWIVGAALGATALKNTGAAALALVPFALGIALWVERGWRWHWLALSGGALAVCVLVAVLDWGDAAYWYRWSFGSTQTSPTRVEVPNAPVGSYAVQLEAPLSNNVQGFVNPLLPTEVRRIAGKTITVGGWVWASQPTTVQGPGVMFNTNAVPGFSGDAPLTTLSTTPVFVARTITVPRDSTVLHYTVQTNQPQPDGAPVDIFLNGAFIIVGEFPAGTEPQFDDSNATNGVWNNQRVTNLLRNPSAENAWPHLRPWFESTLFHYIHRSPSQTVAALFDVSRVGRFTVSYTLPTIIFTFFGAFAWSQAKFQGAWWMYLFEAVAALSAVGGVVWITRKRGQVEAPLAGALLLMAVTLALVWGNVLLRPLPLLEINFVYPIARYGFPAVFPTVLLLVGGLIALLPQRWRTGGAVALLAALLALDCAALVTVHAFFAAV